MAVGFITRDGEHKEGILIRKYSAFEGGVRYIILCGKFEYRCVKNDDGNLVEYVA